jgi:tRNA G18 (ribose-2'-O)-methylase SpoU
MLQIQKIDSLELPALAPYRTLRRPLEHREQGIFVAEGEKVVRRLLESDFTVESLLLPEKWFLEYERLIRSRAEPILVYLAEKHRLQELTGFSMFQGVLAVGRIPAAHTLKTVLEQSAHPYLLAAVDGLANAENVGALVRNCAAFGVQALLVSSSSSSPYLRRAVRNSMGAIFKLPVIERLELAETLHELRTRGVGCIAAHPHLETQKLWQADFSSDCCIIFGSEGYGISADVLSGCNSCVAVPMHSGVDSLNVGHAAAVFFYEASRQRNCFRGGHAVFPAGHPTGAS